MPQLQSQNETAKGQRQFCYSPLLILAVGACLFALRQLAAPNLLDQDQERPAAYVLDVIQNGNWICQRDHFDDVTSKPPMLTWLCAITSLATGHVNEFSLYLPGALAALGTALLLWRAGTKYFGGLAGLISAMAVMLTTAGLKEFGLARTDGVFAFTVAATALLAFEAWQRGKGWIWVWLMAAASVLAKGPLGLLISGGGLIAAIWERKTGHEAPIRGKHWLGVAVFLLITVGWFWLAYLQEGHALIAKMLGKELVAHAVTGKKHYPGMLFYQPILYYLGRAAPWSLFALFGMYRLCRFPAAQTEVRRFERFLFCWFAFGLGLFSLAPHQRADLLWPIMPAGALLAGRELNRLASRLKPTTLRWSFAAVILFAIGGFGFYYFGPRSREKIQQQSLALREFARTLNPPQGAVLTHVDDPMALQIYLGTLHRNVSFDRAAALLRGKEPAFVVVKEISKLEAARQPGETPIQIIAKSPPMLGLIVVGNRSRWEPTNEVAFGSGWMDGRVRGAMVKAVREHEIEVDSKRAGEIQVRNASDSPQKMTLKVRRSGDVLKETRVLGPGELWNFSFPGGEM